MAAEVADAILARRRARPHWGPKKLKAVLMQRQPTQAWPAARTIGDLLQRQGLVPARGRRRAAVPVAQPFLPATAANQRWCIDFKGWFRTRDGQRCDPLTDAASRDILALEIMAPTSGPVAAAVDRLLHEHGLPERLLMDNGPPLAAGGLTRLSVKWLQLGVKLERITPGRPQENGRHARMHRTLKAETSRPPAASPGEQQARFDAFRHDFNHERPHEALGQVPPARVWRPSPRLDPARLEAPWHDAEHAVRRVRSDGGIKGAGTQVFVSEALVGEPVGITELSDGSWLVRFAGIDLGLIDRRSKKLTRFAAARPCRQPSEPTGNSVNHVPGLECQP
jgi:transposase InsO family protein